MQFFKIIFIVIVLVFYSCDELTKEIDYATIYEGDKLMVHGFISPQEGVHLIVKKSVAPNNVQANDIVNNVVVTLYQNEDEIQELMQIGDYSFVSDTNFTVNLEAEYSVKIEADNLETITSLSQFVFEPVKIDSMNLIIDENFNYSNLIVSFYDKKEFGETYYINVCFYVNGIIDMSIIEREIFNPYGLIDNTAKGVNSVEIETGLSSDFDSLKVELYTLSPDLGVFLKSMQNYDGSKEDPFYEQTYPVYSNIDKGYGIFASYSFCSQIVKK